MYVHRHSGLATFTRKINTRSRQMMALAARLLPHRPRLNQPPGFTAKAPPFVSQVQRKPTTRRACVVMNERKSNTYPLAFPPNKGNTHNQARLSEVIGLTPQHSSSPTLIFSRSGQPLMTSLSISSAAGQPINTVASTASRLPIFTPSSSGLDLLASAVAQASPP